MEVRLRPTTRIDAAMKRPMHAFLIGFIGFFVVLALAWVISGDPFDQVWQMQLVLPVGFGFFLAGVAERENPSRWHSLLSRLTAAILLTIAAWTIPPFLHVALNGRHPVISLLVAGVVVIFLYHILLGFLAMLITVVMGARSSPPAM